MFKGYSEGKGKDRNREGGQIISHIMSSKMSLKRDHSDHSSPNPTLLQVYLGCASDDGRRECI